MYSYMWFQIGKGVRQGRILSPSLFNLYAEYITHSSVLAWRIPGMGKQWKQCQTLFFWAPKSLQMVIAALKLKDAYSLGEKL